MMSYRLLSNLALFLCCVSLHAALYAPAEMVLYTNVVNGVTNIVPVYITNRIVAPISVVDNIQPSSNLTTATNTVVDTTLSTNIIVNIQDFTDLSTTETYGSSVLGESKRKAMKDYWYRKDTNAVQAFKKLKYKY